MVDAHHREHPFLNVAAVDTDRAAADLVAVADDVVGVGQRACRVRCRTCASDSGLGEVNAWCTAVHAPEPTATSPEAVASSAGSNSGQSTTQANAHASGSIRSSRLAISMRVAPSSARADFAGTGREEDAVPGRWRRRARPGRRVRRRTGSWPPGPPSVPSSRDQHVGQPLVPALLGELLPAVQRAPRLRRTAGHHHRADIGRLEHPECGVGEVLRALDEFQPEPQVGLVGTEPAHGLGVARSAGWASAGRSRSAPTARSGSLRTPRSRRRRRRSSSPCRAG